MRLGDPDFEFHQLIGARFHQDALLDADSIDEIIDSYLAGPGPPWVVARAARSAHRVLEEGLDDAELEELLRQLGFAFLVQPLGFADYAAFLTHLVQRLDAFLAPLPAEALADDEAELPPMRELTDAEREAFSALLTQAFGVQPPDEEDLAAPLTRWSRGVAAAVLADARSAARALRDGPLLDDELLERLLDLGLGFDPIDDERISLPDFLDLIDDELTLALGEEPWSDGGR